MVLSRVDGVMTNSSSSSGIFFQGDGQSQVQGNPQLGFGNSSNLIPENAFANFGLASGDVSNTVLKSAANSGPSLGASSLVTDTNSGLSGRPHLQRSASIDTESYMHLPASPMSFSSNNVSISGSSVMDGSSVVQQSSRQDPSSQQVQQRQQHQGASSATSLPTSWIGQVQLPGGPRAPSAFIQDPTNMSQLRKKPRLDIKQEDILQQQVLQQLLQRQDPMNLQNPNPQLQALIQQHRIRQQQQQLLQSMTPMQRAQLLQQQQQRQLQLRQQLQQQGLQPASTMKCPNDSSVCSRRLMQYLFHKRQRPPDNTYAYWKKFVAEYYSPRAKKRWCLSLYHNVGHHLLGVFPQAAMDAWQCDICGSKSGRGLEATFEVLPRLNEIKFNSGVIDEILFLDLPRECRFPSGMMMVEYAKAVQESIYEQLRVVHEGQLRIIFAPDLKILSWEFCARRHEELIPRRLIAPQVNQLLQVAQKCQGSTDESGPDGISPRDLQANSVMVVTAGRQLARSLELQSVNDFGFSKRYVRSLHIAEVMNSMKDLMNFCREQKVGPIDGLKDFPRHTTAAKIQMQNMQEMEQMPTGRDMLNKLMALHPGLNTQMNSMNSNCNSLQHEASSSFNNSNPVPNSTFRGSSSGNLPGNLQNSSVSGFYSSHVLRQHQQQHASSGNGLLQQNQPQPSQGSQALEQQMIQQYIQDMSNNNSGSRVLQQSISMSSNNNGSVPGNGPGFRNTISGATAPAANGPGNAVGSTPCRSSSFKTASLGESSAGGGNNGFSQKESTLPLSGEMVHDIVHGFTENGFFDSDLDEMNYSWKA